MVSHASTQRAQIWESCGLWPDWTRALPSIIGPASPVGRPQKSQKLGGDPPGGLPSVLAVTVFAPDRGRPDRPEARRGSGRVSIHFVESVARFDRVDPVRRWARP